MRSLFPIIKSGKRHSPGFTLLEILTAIAIFAVILSTVFPAYTGTFKNIEFTDDQAEIYRMARTTIVRLTEDLESVYISVKSPTGSDDDFLSLLGKTEFLDNRRADTISFHSRSHINFTNSSDKRKNAKIAYYPLLKDDDSITLYRSDTPDNFEWPREETGGFIICERLHSISFTYHDRDGEEYDNWDEALDPSQKKFPSIIDITLRFINKRDPEKPLTFSTAVFIPMAE